MNRRDSGTWYRRFIKGHLLPLHRCQNTQLKGKYEREREKKNHTPPQTLYLLTMLFYLKWKHKWSRWKKRFSPHRDDRTSLLLLKTKAFIHIPK